MTHFVSFGARGSGIPLHQWKCSTTEMIRYHIVLVYYLQTKQSCKILLSNLFKFADFAEVFVTFITWHCLLGQTYCGINGERSVIGLLILKVR